MDGRREFLRAVAAAMGAAWIPGAIRGAEPPPATPSDLGARVTVNFSGRS